jgi:hypothetical protein
VLFSIPIHTTPSMQVGVSVAGNILGPSRPFCDSKSPVSMRVRAIKASKTVDYGWSKTFFMKSLVFMRVRGTSQHAFRPIGNRVRASWARTGFRLLWSGRGAPQGRGERDRGRDWDGGEGGCLAPSGGWAGYGMGDAWRGKPEWGRGREGGGGELINSQRV